jgi:PAS domain S-box-containing protein
MATYTCVRDNNGHVEKILFLAIDTTEQKKQSLDYEGQIQALNNSSLKAEFEPNGKIIQCNQQFLAVFGFDFDEEIKNKSIFDFVLKEELDEFKKTWKNTIAGTSYLGQGRKITNTSLVKWFHETLTAVSDMYGDVAKVIYIATDISEQKKMEQETLIQSEELQKKEKDLIQNIEQLQNLQLEMRKNQQKLEESEKKLKKQLEVIEIEKKKNMTILEGCVEGILTFNQDGIIELLNKTAEDIIGCSKDELVGQNINSIFNIKLQKESDSIIAYYQNGELKKLNNIKTEINIKNIGGEMVPVLLTLNEIKLQNGSTFAAFIQNIEVELF